MNREIWRVENRPPARAYRRVREAIRRRRERWFPAAVRHAPAGGPLRGPRFPISGFEAGNDELAAIFAHPAVCAAIDGPALPPFAVAPPPALRFPSGHERLAAADRPRPAPLYDIVPFGFESDLLELRLLTLDHVVDRFIVVESPVGHGGVRKGLRLNVEDPRWRRFAAKLHHVVIDEDEFARRFDARRRRADAGYEGEDVIRSMAWREIRERIVFEPDAIIVYADLDEFPPADFLHWLRCREVELPVRLDLQTLRYSFRWRDFDTPAQIVMFTPAHFDVADAVAARIRNISGQVFGARGAAHLTSFLDPLALVAKFAMTTDWDPGIVTFLRNEHDETARMMAAGQWFGRHLSPYDAERDPDGLVPWAARAHRDRFAHFWTRRES